jgi:hypothetical protein
MKRLVVPLLLALGALAPAGAQNQTPVIHHPVDSNGQPSYFPLAQAYPAMSHPLSDCIRRPGSKEPCINRTWCGERQRKEDDPLAPVPGRAVSGILSLCTVPSPTMPDQRILDALAFATCPPGQRRPIVDFVLLAKEVPGSAACPDPYSAATFLQFGEPFIRTWWALDFTQPGTRFTLDVTVRCLNKAGEEVTHIDRWVWQVVVTPESFQRVIDLLHSKALGTLEIPCIVSETTFRLLQQRAGEIRTAIEAGDSETARAAILSTEALLVASCLFLESLPPTPEPPPGFGIIDTPDYPCCCKLIVDLEALEAQLPPAP